MDEIPKICCEGDEVNDKRERELENKHKKLLEKNKIDCSCGFLNSIKILVFYADSFIQ